MTENNSGGFVVTGEAIGVARLLAIRSALSLEIKGLGRRGRSARALANEAMGTNIKTARATYTAFNKWLTERYTVQDKPLS